MKQSECDTPDGSRMASCKCHVFAKRQPVLAFRKERISSVRTSYHIMDSAQGRSRFPVWLENRMSPTDLRPMLRPRQGCGPWEKRGETVAWHGPSAPGNRSDQRSRLNPLPTRIYGQKRIARSFFDNMCLG